MISWRLRLVVRRCQVFPGKLSAQDSVMVLMALAALKVRLPEISSVAYRCCVSYASSLSISARDDHQSNIHTQGTTIEVLSALAALQHRANPLIKKRLWPQLRTLDWSTHARSLQRAALAAVRLGRDEVDSSALCRLTEVTLVASHQDPSDKGLLLALCGLVGLHPCFTARRNSSGSPQEAAHHAAAVIAGFQQGGALSSGASSSSNLDAAELMASPYALLGYLLWRLSNWGGVGSSVGNDVYHLLHLWHPLLHAHHGMSNATRHDQAAAEVLQHIAAFGHSLQLDTCVPGGFANYVHEHLSLMVESFGHSGSLQPFVRKLLVAMSHSRLAQAFNSYDVSKLSDAIYNTRWESVSRSVLLTRGVGGKEAVRDVLLSATLRLAQHAEFFADANSKKRSHPLKPDGVLVCSVLRTLLRISQVKTLVGESEEELTAGSEPGSAIMKAVCKVSERYFVADAGHQQPHSLHLWPATLLPRALLVLIKCFRHDVPMMVDDMSPVVLDRVVLLNALAQVATVMLQQRLSARNATRTEAIDGVAGETPRDVIQILHACSLLWETCNPPATKNCGEITPFSKALHATAALASDCLSHSCHWDIAAVSSGERDTVMFSTALCVMICSPLVQLPVYLEPAAVSVLATKIGASLEGVRVALINHHDQSVGMDLVTLWLPLVLRMTQVAQKNLGEQSRTVARALWANVVKRQDSASVLSLPQLHAILAAAVAARSTAASWQLLTRQDIATVWKRVTEHIKQQNVSDGGSRAFRLRDVRLTVEILEFAHELGIVVIPRDDNGASDSDCETGTDGSSGVNNTPVVVFHFPTLLLVESGGAPLAAKYVVRLAAIAADLLSQGQLAKRPHLDAWSRWIGPLLQFTIARPPRRQHWCVTDLLNCVRLSDDHRKLLLRDDIDQERLAQWGLQAALELISFYHSVTIKFAVASTLEDLLLAFGQWSYWRHALENELQATAVLQWRAIAMQYCATGPSNEHVIRTLYAL